MNTPAFQDPSTLSTEEKIKRATDAITRLYRDGHPVCIAYSGGKDSTIVLALALNAAVEHAANGGSLPQILITHANTGIENPGYQAVIINELERIKLFIESYKLPARIDVAVPALNDSWAVSVISGRVLPTFAKSSTRQCSVMFKVKPQERQRKAALKMLKTTGDPVVLIGTRFEESPSRAQRMQDRGELDSEIWVSEVIDPATQQVKSTELRLSPIAWWTDEDVWTYLADLRSGKRLAYTDVEAIWDAYAAGGGGGSCAVVGDEGMKANSKACGARFGCALCTAVGRDKSLESMIESDPSYEYMRHLNRLQRFLVHTQDNMNSRNWIGRTIDEDGFIAIAPDTYSPKMLRNLLRMCLSIQEEERSLAASLGIPPRFTLITDGQLLAIDAIWSCQALQPRPFEALSIWHDVVVQGKRYLPPVIEEGRSPVVQKVPAARYLHVGNFEDNPDLDNTGMSPLFNVVGAIAGVGEARDQAIERERLKIKEERKNSKISKAEEVRRIEEAASNYQGCIGFRHLSSGALVTDVMDSELFEIDEAAASDFLSIDSEYCLKNYHNEKTSVTKSYNYYAQTGLLSTSSRHLNVVEAMMCRAAWKERHGLNKMSTPEIIALSISKDERKSGMKAPHGEMTLMEKYHDTPQMKRLRHLNEIMRNATNKTRMKAT